jgi:hypothetical protein
MLRGGRVVFAPLMCGSWSCASCRKQLAAQLLDRLRRGLELRSCDNRQLLTLTLDPAKFGAVVVGKSFWDKHGKPCLPNQSVRSSVLWSEPTLDQFDRATKVMSAQFSALICRLNKNAARQFGVWERQETGKFTKSGRPRTKMVCIDYERVGYFRVVELHRNGWPHYHVLLEHSQLDLSDISWSLGISDVRPISLDDAVGEVAPYLVCSEKGAGSKAYQFAASALPKHFRLWSASKGFLGSKVQDMSGSGAGEVQDDVPAPPEVEYALTCRGHFTEHMRSAREWGSSAVYICPSPAEPEKPHRPISGAECSGDGAVMYYTQLVDHAIAHDVPKGWVANYRTIYNPDHVLL